MWSFTLADRSEMGILNLINIKLDANGFAQLLSLPAPERFDFGSPTTKQQEHFLGNFFALWQQIVAPSFEPPLKRHQHTCPKDHFHTIEGKDIDGCAFLSICAYYDHVLRRFIAKEGHGLPPGFQLSAWAKFHDKQSASECKDQRLKRIRVMSSNYFQTACASYFARTFKRCPIPAGLITVFESSAHNGLKNLFEHVSYFDARYDRIAANRLMAGALELVCAAYEADGSFNKEHKPGPFSSIHLDELSLLARRDPSVIKKYGEKRVEKVFEGQLALIIQSFGMYVVSTETGRRTVDLVCLSGQTEERITFLVEAKSSKHPYSLPTKDARALRDYVADIQRSLPTLPELRFVLIIAQKAGTKLAVKLAQLESQAGVPVRFITAQQVADLREAVPGPMPMRIFSERLLQSEPIINDCLVKTIVEAYNAEQRAHKQFVESMLSARGVIQLRKEWRERDN